MSYNSTMLSGKFVLRVDPKLHKELKEEAQEQGESLNALCVKRLLGSRKESRWCDIVEVIKDEFRPTGIVLFGSVARGDATEKSDIDLLIVLEDAESIDRDKYKRWDKVVSFNRPYSPQFVHLPRASEPIGSIWLETSIDGEVLYDPSGTLEKTFRNIRLKIAEGLYQRKESHGHAYWVRQGDNAK